ncbi:PTS sugar transporter subunit IIB [uncultured Deefgea sp.]|uniref:PTS sugar transporter subunit IIB n=1 Tax=uncultured Deefgea sp. TaxID=1304914 RepID=UPI00261B5781|nr:PTS sugar transporter subunit IIB [uncultured Deefgea sp.]
MKIMIVCGNGLGSSMMLEMTVNSVLKEMGVIAEVGHTDLFSAKGEVADLFVGSHEIMSQLDDGSRQLAGVRNIMDKAEVRAALELKLNQ